MLCICKPCRLRTGKKVSKKKVGLRNGTFELFDSFVSRGTDELISQVAEATGELISGQVGTRAADYLIVQMEVAGIPSFLQGPAEYAARKAAKTAGRVIGRKVAGLISRRRMRRKHGR